MHFNHNCYYEKIGNSEPVKLEDLPFNIPENWTWIKFPNLVNFVLGKTPERHNPKYWNDGKYPWFSIADMKDKKTVYETKEKVSECSLIENFNSSLSLAGTLIMSFKLTVGRVSILGVDAVHNEAIISIFPYLNANNSIRDWLFYTLGLIVEYVDQTDAIKGSTLNKEKMSSMLIPLPPLNEQNRIISKLLIAEPLIADYDKLENKLSILEAEFPEKLKKSILQYAIEGKLVKQDPNDEPASVLLERIKAEKEKLIKEGKIKRDKNESYIYQGDDKNYYENLPENWCFVPLGSLGTLTRGSGIKRSETVNNGYPCIRYGELYTTYNTSFVHAKSFIPKELYDRSHKIKTNDVVMSLTGENKEDISKGLAYLGLNEIAMGGDMACFSHHKMNPLYLVYVLNSPYGISIKRQLATGDIIVHMSNDRLSSIGIPVPPLNEQERICERIMSICRLID